MTGDLTLAQKVQFLLEESEIILYLRYKTSLLSQENTCPKSPPQLLEINYLITSHKAILLFQRIFQPQSKKSKDNFKKQLLKFAFLIAI